LKISFIRDGNHQLIGSVTDGFGAESAVVRDPQGRMLGRTSQQFKTTRDSSGRLVSTNTADAGLLLRGPRVDYD
jgi:YD repeat-containing protein